jgi:hypothetical protein
MIIYDYLQFIHIIINLALPLARSNKSLMCIFRWAVTCKSQSISKPQSQILSLKFKSFLIESQLEQVFELGKNLLAIITSLYIQSVDADNQSLHH